MDTALELRHLTPFKRAILYAADEAEFPPFILAALALRESDATWGLPYHPKGDPCGWGDGGNAYGIFQIDKRWHSMFISSMAAKTPEGQANYAAGLLDQNKSRLHRMFPYLQECQLQMAALCAYNAPLVKVARAIGKHQDPNIVTKNGNYGHWIIEKAADLKSAAPSFFNGKLPD